MTSCGDLTSESQKTESSEKTESSNQSADSGQTGSDQTADQDNQTSDSGSAASDSQSNETDAAASAGNTASTVDLSSIPAYDGRAYVSINNNVPAFSDADKARTDAFETYSDLDDLGRCGVAYANVCKEIMPTEKRGAIGAVRPSGWHTIKYDIVDGKYLYNRCHLIGYQLSGENANAKNLITGTRYLNTEGMLPFENMVADYVKETGHHVLYRVTPIFQDNNLVASGVQMEAWSVEDQGAGICFNVYCYNVQPGITIDYASGASGRNGQPLSNQGARSQSTGDNSSSGGSSGSSSGAVSQQSQAAQQSSQQAAQSTQQASQDTASANSGSERTVYITGSGKHYHLTTSCRGLRQAKSITPISESDAIARGYTLCGFEK
ncbi:MAG: DNA/RNA non-specific endonuclease [Lachnospiraceae bacterium]|nr:DNA/RNA non-specific endonuclease [Lachnospiraceae bacterium]